MMLPGGLSADAYLERKLRPPDAQHYSGAGLIPYRNIDGRVELLLPREKPWNSFTQAYDPIALNLFGGKRVPRLEHQIETTAARCFSECVEQVEGSPDFDLDKLAYSSFVVWYPAGKFAILLVEVEDQGLSDLPARFNAMKESAGGAPTEEYRMLPQGIKKWVKQIEGMEWIPASQLVPEPKGAVSDLLLNALKVPGFREFLEGTVDPMKSLPAAVDQPQFQRHDNGGKKGDRKGGKDKGKGGGGKASGGKGKGFKGGHKGGKGDKGMPMQMYSGGKGMPLMMGPGPMMYSAYDQNSAEMQRQMYGEQLYVMVQPLVPSAYVAQKITGMLLELPQNELLMNLTNPEEMHRRVSEAMEVLKEDGVV